MDISANSYNRLLHTKEWQKYRLKVFINKKAYCHNCGNREHLQVHHLRYYEDKLPYEYDMGDVVVLCNKCHYDVHHNNLVLKDEPFKREVKKKKLKKSSTKNKVSNKRINKKKKQNKRNKKSQL